MSMFDVPDPNWKLDPDIVADESFEAVFGENEEDYYGDSE